MSLCCCFDLVLHAIPGARRRWREWGRARAVLQGLVMPLHPLIMATFLREPSPGFVAGPVLDRACACAAIACCAQSACVFKRLHAQRGQIGCARGACCVRTR